jgi:flagellar motor switch protein FliM
VSALSRFSANSIAELRRRGADPNSEQALEDSLAKTAVEMVVELAETRLTAGEVADLEIGDVIVTKHNAADGVKVYVEGRQIFSGSAGLLRGRKAVRMGDSIDAPPDASGPTGTGVPPAQDEP